MEVVREEVGREEKEETRGREGVVHIALSWIAQVNPSI